MKEATPLIELEVEVKKKLEPDHLLLQCEVEYENVRKPEEIKTKLAKLIADLEAVGVSTGDIKVKEDKAETKQSILSPKFNVIRKFTVKVRKYTTFLDVLAVLSKHKVEILSISKKWNQDKVHDLKEKCFQDALKKLKAKADLISRIYGVKLKLVGLKEGEKKVEKKEVPVVDFCLYRKTDVNLRKVDKLKMDSKDYSVKLVGYFKVQ